MVKIHLEESLGFPCRQLSQESHMSGKNGKAYLSMFDPQAAAVLDQHELDPTEVTDEDLQVSVVDDNGVTSLDRAATTLRVPFSRKLHCLLAHLTVDSARLVVRQKCGSNGFETWRRFVKKFSLPGATRHVSLLTQLLDFKFSPQSFEQDFNTWETIKVKYEKQTGTALPDDVLVAILLNKTSGALQQHVRLNARTLTTYEEIRAAILDYHQSRHILAGASSSSTPGGLAPMDIGGLKGKKGFGKSGFGYFKGKERGKGKKGGKFGKGEGKNPHVNFHNAAMAKGKRKDKGKSKLRGQQALVCWTCGKPGHVASNCPSGRVSALDENAVVDGEKFVGDQAWTEDDWAADTWSEDWWSDGLVAAVFGYDGTWDDDWWWSTWDDGWSDAWADTSWSVVPPPAVQKATSSAAPSAPDPKATSGAPVGALTLQMPVAPKAKAKATSK